ncbi:MAG: AMP-binding protein, partial [Candidatus Aminicenantes bacterium]|nr:AMP-binding protein [Candidatus Aminicenantes bacterium]NIN23759.1 AMP-binding protein [Candidatus Aminicenantes bacterium]NIN90395.1 AMP-binding protein [Candidatus Aminicenantes bacterium]NIQ66454.1 AMP-binding protein [Candidatus Aminicenantes bacterium]NIR05215.1 AMP-binding protein [Candidatus Aminicenantes bacterium]
SQWSGSFPIRRFVIGGDVLKPSLVEELMNILCRDGGRKDFEIVNVYGPTECCDVTTLFTVSGELPETGQYMPSIPIGRPLENVKVYIMGLQGGLQPIGAAGELCIGGAGLARGYLSRPELTAEKFIKGTRGLAPLLYRSGDLARWLADGNIEFLGRKDQQVKIRGFRIELGEIESQLLKREEIKETVILAKDKEDGDKYLCAYIVTGDRDDTEQESYASELRKYLNRRLPDYMVPSFFIKVDQMPLTFNGKINRKALPVPVFKDDTQKYTAPRDVVERKLVEIWSQVLAIEMEKIGIDDNFFQLGGHSLKAAIANAKIHKELKVKLPLAEVFRVPTIRHLSECVKGEERYEYLPIEAAEKRDYYVLSSQQKRLYILQQMEADNISYNLPVVVRLEGELNKEKFDKV